MKAFVIIVVIIIVVVAVVCVLYRIGKNAQKELPNTSKKELEKKYISNNPNTIYAQRAFVENLDKLLPYFSGVSEITIDKQGLTDAIISINNDDLISIWKNMMDKPDLWINQISAWGVKPEFCQSFVAMEKHKALYVTADNKELELGEKYEVTSASWILTTNEDGRVIKKIVKKGIVNKKQ